MLELYHVNSLQLNFIRSFFCLDSAMREIEGSYTARWWWWPNCPWSFFPCILFIHFFYYWRPIPRNSGNFPFFFHLVLSFSHPAAGPQGATTQTRLGAIYTHTHYSLFFFFCIFFFFFFPPAMRADPRVILPGTKWRMVSSSSSSWLDSLLRPLNIPSFLLRKTKKNASSSRYYEETATIGQFSFPSWTQL